MIELLEFLGRGRIPAGPRVGVISESGGESALFADLAGQAGLSLPALPQKQADALARSFPNLRRSDNPLDAWAVDEPDRIFPAALAAFAESGAFDTLVAQVDLSRSRGAMEDEWCRTAIEGVASAAIKADLAPAVVTVHTSDPPQELAEVARQRGVPLLRGMRNATKAIASIAGWLPRVGDAPEERPIPRIGDLIVRSGALPEFESSEIMRRYGVPVAPAVRASSPADAVNAAERLGYPVVVKFDGPPHKGELDGVRLNLRSGDAVREAAASLEGPTLVASQIPAGAEVICGMVRDPQFGPVVAVGRGGSGVEAFTRPATAAAPFGLDTARELIGTLDLGPVVLQLASPMRWRRFAWRCRTWRLITLKSWRSTSIR